MKKDSLEYFESQMDIVLKIEDIRREIGYGYSRRAAIRACGVRPSTGYRWLKIADEIDQEVYNAQCAARRAAGPPDPEDIPF